MRDWTFMVYMAGDNGKVFDGGGRLMHDLQSFGWRNIADMCEVGSTQRVAIVAQYDTLDNQQYTPRFYIDGSKPTGQLIEIIPPVNTGDPKNLTDFIVWGATNYPAQHYALILWNHGTGWKEDDIYARYRESISQAGSRGEMRASQRGEKIRRALFVSTAGKIMSIQDDNTRGICYDDSSTDFLDNQDLVDALTAAETQIGQPLSLLGMDACLMSMVEVAYQVRKHADVMVGSQEIEPGTGWPYTIILRALVDNPDMTAADLGKHIVKTYGDSYMNSMRGGGSNLTQSAIDLRRMEMTGQRIGILSKLLTDTYDSDFLLERAIGRSLIEVQRFRDADNADLQHFLELLAYHYSGTGRVLEAIADMRQALAETSASAPVIANFHGANRKDAHGLSIYFPFSGCSIYYDNLEFAGIGWRDLIYKRNRLGSQGTMR